MFELQHSGQVKIDQTKAHTQNPMQMKQSNQRTANLPRLPLYTLAWGNQPPPWLRLPTPQQATHEMEPLQERFEPIQCKEENTTGLPDTLKTGIEILSGISLDNVNVYYHSPQPPRVQALAYTQGTNIHVGPGQEKHLAHEAWHIVQQKQGRVKPTMQAKGVTVNNEQALEQEADVMGERATQQGIANQDTRLFAVSQLRHIDSQNLSHTTPIQAVWINRGYGPEWIDDNQFFQPIWVNNQFIWVYDSSTWVPITLQNGALIYVHVGIVQQIRAQLQAQLPPPTLATQQPVVPQVVSPGTQPQTVPPTVTAQQPVVSQIVPPSTQPLPTTQPVKGPKQTPRRRINLGNVTGTKKTGKGPKQDAGFLQLLHDLNITDHNSFYSVLSKQLHLARNGNTQATQNLDDLLKWYHSNTANKELIDKYVRVGATKRPGMQGGAGLDELFKTSETTTFIQWSYKPPSGKATTDIYSGQEFDWMDAQQYIRLSTELIIWSLKKIEEIGGACDLISGHTGSLVNQYQLKWMTTAQAHMHELRQNALATRSSPGNAIMTVLQAHLDVTINQGEFSNLLAKNFSKALLRNGAFLGHALAPVIKQIGKIRDKIKHFLEEFPKQATHRPSDIGNISPIALHGQPPSPKSGEPYTPPRMEPESGERLPQLSKFMLVDWEKLNKELDAINVAHEPIPKAPPDPNKKRKGKGQADPDEDE